MKIKGSEECTANFHLLDGILSVKQGENTIRLTPDQAKALADYVNENYEAERKAWQLTEG